MTTIDPTAAFNDIAARYTAARADLRAAKKAHGKKSTETKAARKVVRAIKKERAEFAAENPGFKAPPKAKKAAPGMQYKPETPKVDRTAGETIGIFRGGKWYAPDGVTEVPGPGADDLVTVQAAQPGPVGEVVPPAPAVVAAEAVAPVAKGQLSTILLGILAEGHIGTPSQIAALAKGEDFGTTITAKMAADALGRLAKAGKCRKAGAGKYAALGGETA